MKKMREETNKESLTEIEKHPQTNFAVCKTNKRIMYIAKELSNIDSIAISEEINGSIFLKHCRFTLQLKIGPS
jgi:hypothetical protein